MKGWFDAFRENGGPTLYSYSNRTSVVGDISTFIICIVFSTLFVSFIIVFPGIRKEVSFLHAFCLPACLFYRLPKVTWNSKMEYYIYLNVLTGFVQSVLIKLQLVNKLNHRWISLSFLRRTPPSTRYNRSSKQQHKIQDKCKRATYMSLLLKYIGLVKIGRRGMRNKL